MSMTAVSGGVQRLVDRRGFTRGYRTWDPVLGFVDTIIGNYESLSQLMERRRAAIQSGVAPTPVTITAPPTIDYDALPFLFGGDVRCDQCFHLAVTWVSVATNHGPKNLALCSACGKYSRSYLKRFNLSY